MLRKKSDAVPEGNGPVSQQEEFGSGQPTLVDAIRTLYERMNSRFDRQEKMLDEIIMRMTRGTSQRAASLEHDARQPRLAIEVDGPVNTKTRKRTEGAATAVQAMHGDSCTAQKVQDGPKTSTSFGMKAETPALLCRDDVTVESGDAALKSCLTSLEMRSPTAADGLLPTDKTSTATKITFNKPSFRFHSTEETNPKEKKLGTSVPSAWYDSSFWRNKLLAVPSCRKVIETKSGQNRTLDPGGS